MTCERRYRQRLVYGGYFPSVLFSQSIFMFHGEKLQKKKLAKPKELSTETRLKESTRTIDLLTWIIRFFNLRLICPK